MSVAGSSGDASQREEQRESGVDLNASTSNLPAESGNGSQTPGVSRVAGGDASLTAGSDGSSLDVVATGVCAWCAAKLWDRRAKFCGQKCRQAAFRLRCRSDTSLSPAETGPLRFAYADPPYPGLSKLYYGDQPSYAGEVDHKVLVEGLEARRQSGELAGWALSTAARSLRDILPLCPEGVHVAAWVMDLEVPPLTYGAHYRWAPVVVAGGRKMRPGVIDWLQARPARLGGSDLPGRKPVAFWAWLFDLLGMVPGDGFEDLFPGTGTGARAWAHLSSVARVTGDVSVRARGDASVADGRRVVLARLVGEVPGDASLGPGQDGRSVAMDVSDDGGGA